MIYFDTFPDHSGLDAAAKITIPESTRLLLLQNEIPGTGNGTLAAAARAMGCKTILNAAPARSP